jgi:hypothetical protein
MKNDVSIKWSTCIILMILTLAILSPIYYLNSYVKPNTDFPLHALFAADLKEKGIQSLPAFTIAHSAWQYVLVFLNRLAGFSFKKAGFLVAVFAGEMTSLILFLWFWPALADRRTRPWKIPAILLGISIAAPVSLFWPVDHHMYLGYIGITTYHSPTIILLKPFAILQFVLAYRCFDHSTPLKNGQVFAAGLVSLIGTYIKPSLAICLLPALGVYALRRMAQRKYVNLPGLILGFGLPSVLLLLWQFFVTYFANETGSITFSPLEVMGAYSQHLILKLLLSILFPLSVLIAFFKQAKNDGRMMLGWLVFGIGLFFTYFFAEGGPRQMDGNFGWGAEIALMLLFMMSSLFYLEMPRKRTWADLSVQAAWFLQVAFGVVYYFYCVYNNTYI